MSYLKNLSHQLLAVFFFPLLIFIRLIRPFYKIRLRVFMSERIGHFTGDAGISLCNKLGGQKYKDICWFVTPSCNTQLEKMVRRVFFVRWWVRYLILANNFFPSFKLVPSTNKWMQARDIRGLYFKTKDIKEAYLPFSHKEEIEAKQFLNSFGIRDSDKFICLIIRDSDYLNAYYPNQDWSYHDFRDTSIHSYKEAIETLANLGYWVFRMGKMVKEPLNISHPRIIDYATLDDKSDLLDIWLPAKAYFSISTSTGLDAVPQAYRRPVVYVNAMTNADFRSHDHCIWAPKNLVWESKEGSLLTLKETLIHNLHHSEKYKEKGIKVIDLSSKQIREIIIEMEMRLSGNWNKTKEEEVNQRKFIKIISSWPNKGKLHGFIHPEARISQKYLEYNPSFLSGSFN